MASNLHGEKPNGDRNGSGPTNPAQLKQGPPPEWRVFLQLTTDKWRVIRGGLIGAGLTLLAIAISTVAFVYHWNALPGVIFGVVTALYWICLIPWSMYEVWRDEHRARNTELAQHKAELERQQSTHAAELERERLASRPRIAGSIVGFPSIYTPEQASTLPDGRNDFWDSLKVRGGNWYIVRLRLTNRGADSSTQNWRARVRWNGEWLEVRPEAMPWSPPSEWGELPFWDLSRVQSDALTHGPAYHVFFWANIKGPAAYVEQNSFEVTFEDNLNEQIACTVKP